MNGFVKRAVAAILAGTVVLGATGCSCKKVYFTTGLSGNEVFKIGGVATTRQEAMLYLTCEKNLYEGSYSNEIWNQSLSEGMTLEDYVKDTVKERLAQISALNQLAKSKKISLSEKEKKRVERAAEAFYNGLTEDEIKYMDASLKVVNTAYSKYALAQKVYDELTKDVNPEISDAEALVVKVQSIYIKTYSLDTAGNKVPFSKKDRRQAKEKADDLLKKVKSDGAEFAEIANKYSDAEKTEYVFGKGEMVEEFEKAAYNLKDDEISKVISTDSGYYIIKCIEDYMIEETQANKEKLIEDAKSAAFEEIYRPYLDSVTSEFNDKVWDEIKFTDGENINTSNFYDIYNKYTEDE